MCIISKWRNYGVLKHMALQYFFRIPKGDWTSWLRLVVAYFSLSKRMVWYVSSELPMMAPLHIPRDSCLAIPYCISLEVNADQKS
jgi:hypothetical protein